MSQIIPSSFHIFLLVLLTTISFIEAVDDTLRFVLIEENGSRIVLNWKKTNRSLINENTPVWLATRDVGNGNSNLEYQPDFIASNLPNFMMFQDLAESSAVMYFPQIRGLRGNIGLKYKIERLPLEELEREHSVIGSPYVKEYENMRILHDYVHTPEHSDDNSVTVLYPEILVLVTHELFIFLKRKLGQMRAMMMIVMQKILYFNAINMMFNKLSTENVKIHINIAGIIIEKSSDVFPLPLFSDNGIERVNSEAALLFSIPKFLKQSEFSDDFFDFFFVSTGFPLKNDVARNGFSTPKFPMFELRATKKPSDIPRSLGTIVKYEDGYASYITASHRIAWLMNMNTRDLPTVIEWTEFNVQELKNYARGDRNRCFLLNFPRSLRPIGRPAETISPSNQCSCYGFNPVHTELNVVGHSGCHQPLECKHKPNRYGDHDSRPKNTPLPIDGTPCDSNKVCWHKHCRNL